MYCFDILDNVFRLKGPKKKKIIIYIPKMWFVYEVDQNIYTQPFVHPDLANLPKSTSQIQKKKKNYTRHTCFNMSLGQTKQNKCKF